MDERILPDLWFRRELEFPRYYRDQLAVSAPSLVSLITTNDPLAMRDRGDLRPEHRFGADTTRYHILSISISDRLDNNKEPIRAVIGGSSKRESEKGAQRQHTARRPPMVFGSSRKSSAAADADAASPAAAPAAAEEKRGKKKKSASDKSASAPAGAEAEEQSSQPAAQETSAVGAAVNKAKSAEKLAATASAVAAGDMSAEDVAAQHGGARTQVRKARSNPVASSLRSPLHPPAAPVSCPRRTTSHLVATRQLWASPGGSQVGSR